MKKAGDFTVMGLRWLNYSAYIIELEAPEPLTEVLPGNFAEIEINNSPKVFLRRPFSIFDVNPRANTLSFYVKVIGEGTRVLGQSRKGNKVNIIYPLGNSFRVPEADHTLVVAGGSGIAPFLLYGRQMQKAGRKATFLFGARNAEEIVPGEFFKPFGDVLVTTQDGSLGEKGLVTEHSIFNTAPFPFGHVVTCGPEPMMKAVARIAREKNATCEVSLENTMACGFGACLCCIVETTSGNKCVCTEGPVFNINQLTWQT